MRDCDMARTILSGTSAGPGIWRKGRPGIRCANAIEYQPRMSSSAKGKSKVLSRRSGLSTFSLRTSIDVAPGVIRAAHEGTGFDVAETKFLGFELELLEFLRRYVAIDAKLAIRWL